MQHRSIFRQQWRTVFRRRSTNPHKTLSVTDCQERECSTQNSATRIASKLRTFIERELWDAMFSVLTSEECKSVDEDSMQFAESGDNVLHLACKHHAPLEVVVGMMEQLPNAAAETNRQGQYALHCAAQWGACPEVIHLIYNAHHFALEHQDNDDRTPLMLACKYYRTNYRYTKGEPTISQAVAATIRMLARSCPSVSILEDKEHLSSIEYALYSGVDLGTIRCIQMASCREWKRREGSL